MVIGVSSNGVSQLVTTKRMVIMQGADSCAAAREIINHDEDITDLRIICTG